MHRILIVEDDVLIAMDLEATVSEIVDAAIIVKASIAGTKKVLDQPLDFAFLDVDVTNGKTFEVAQLLGRRKIPFVFVSARKSKKELPVELRNVPIIPKPFYRAEIERALQARLE